MKYALFDTMTGAVLDRTPTEVHGGLPLEFVGAVEGSRVMLTTEDGVVFYVKIENGACVAPFLTGKIQVRVKHFGTRVDTWVCEPLKVIDLGEGRALVYPEDQDIFAELVRVRMELQGIRDEQKVQKGDILATNKRLDDMLEGWGIT